MAINVGYGPSGDDGLATNSDEGGEVNFVESAPVFWGPLPKEPLGLLVLLIDIGFSAGSSPPFVCGSAS